MSDMLRRRGLKRLNLGGAGKSEYLMIGALVVIIVGSLVFTIMRFTGDGAGGGGPAAEMKFQCQQCGHIFTPDPAQGEQYEMAMEMGMAGLDCPNCGAEKSALIMTKCPSCGEYYVSDQTKWEAKYSMSDQPPPPGPAPRSVCPKCGTDYQDWWRKKREERRKD